MPKLTSFLFFALLSTLANGNVDDWQPQQVHLSLGGNFENSFFIGSIQLRMLSKTILEFHSLFVKNINTEISSCPKLILTGLCLTVIPT